METHHMKNKLIGKGYKIFALTTTDGFVANFTPGGRTSTSTGCQDIVDQFREKQKKRLSKVTTRAPDEERELDIKMETFCLAMDNFFTVTTVIKCLRDNGISVVGTARTRRGWLLSVIQNIQQKDCDFNDFRYLIDDIGNSIKVERKRSHITLKNKQHVEKVWGKQHRNK
eukprot:5330589-Ditylum_brightwellii.AAC.1